MNIEDIDPGLYGVWEPGGYGGGASPRDGVTAALEDDGTGENVRALLLELKSAELAESGDLRLLLNEITGELKAQLQLFIGLRKEAEAALATPDADQKQARADMKTCSDAISVIVRTLDKTDELQRKLADARDAEAERALDDRALEEICTQLNRHIEARAADIAARASRQAGGEAAGRDDKPG